MTIDWGAVEGFAWDAGNVAKSEAKHGVTASEAEQLFARAPTIVLPDPKHSAAEPRYYLLGETLAGRMLIAAFTIRVGLVRVISVRPMNRRERAIYEAEEAKS